MTDTSLVHNQLVVTQWDRMLGAAVLGGATLSAYAIVTCLRSASLDHLELFHIYYQPLLVMLAMLWLWAIDVRIFERRRIAYSVCFSPQDQQYLRSSHQLFQARDQFNRPQHPHQRSDAFSSAQEHGAY